MSLTCKLLFLLALLAALDVCRGVASTAGRSKFHIIENQSDLWRFQVGQTADGLTLGNAFLCILSHKTKFLASRIGRVYHDRDWCEGEERFAVEFLDDGKVTLRPSLSKDYVSCMDNGDAILQGEVTERQKWQLQLNQDDDQLSFYNTFQKKYLSAREDGSVRCDRSTKGAFEMFEGWREGSKEAWEPREEGRLLKKLDNSRGKAVKTFKFRKTIGVKEVGSSKAKVRVDEPMIYGNGLAKKFKVGYESELHMDWAKEDPAVWKKAKTVPVERDVEPKMIVTLYQAVGIYGPLEIYSDHIMVREEEAGEPQAQEATQL